MTLLITSSAITDATGVTADGDENSAKFKTVLPSVLDAKRGFTEELVLSINIHGQNFRRHCAVLQHRNFSRWFLDQADEDLVTLDEDGLVAIISTLVLCHLGMQDGRYDGSWSRSVAHSSCLHRSHTSSQHLHNFSGHLTLYASGPMAVNETEPEAMCRTQSNARRLHSVCRHRVVDCNLFSAHL